jgi:Sulfate permease family
MTRQDEDSYRRGRSPFRPPARRPLLARLVPVSERLRGTAVARSGATCGRVTVAALALPEAMAYGELAGLTAVAGLYTCCCPRSPTPCSAPPAS